MAEEQSKSTKRRLSGTSSRVKLYSGRDGYVSQDRYAKLAEAGSVLLLLADRPDGLLHHCVFGYHGTDSSHTEEGNQVLSRVSVAGTFENLSKEYNRNLSVKQSSLDKALEEIKNLKDKIKKYDSFLEAKGLVEAFAEFIRPKTVHENIAEKQKIVEASKKKAKSIEVLPKKKHDIAI